ncbi:MAG: Npt1/Npt2 family nucleotide transporter [Candidatus Babeliales bacterium]
MLKRIAAALWGNFESTDEVKKFSLLGSLFLLIIGTYWALRPIKDSIFGAIVGMSYQPMAKWLSLLLIVPLVIAYGKLIDKFQRQYVFYILTIVYATLALVFAWYFSDPVVGLANKVADPSRVIGWLWYIYVESFGSLIVALFWAFTTDITTEESASRGFPLISLFGQTGNILGPLVLNAQRWGFSHSGPIVAVVGIMTLLMGVLMWVFMQVVPKSQLKGYQAAGEATHGNHEKESEPGFLEGLKLLVSQPYLLGIFLIITIYEVIVTVFDYHLKTMSKAVYPNEVDHAAYLTNYAIATGIVATICLLLGINNIQRKLGATASLIMMPILVAVAIVTLKFSPALGVVFWIMVFAKAVNYALNQPTLKQLYIPTTKETKYKSQAWIEMFGSRGAKGAGSIINNFQKAFIKNYGAQNGMALFITMSSIISMSLVVGWLFVVLYVAKTYNKAIKHKEVVC